MPLALTHSLRTLLLPLAGAGLLAAGLLAAGLLAGCASDKNLVLHTLNNVAARDNAFFIARTKLQETETKLYAARVNNYNEVLPLFPTLDSAAVKGNRTELNDIIKKASMPIQHRPGSDWTDDAYLLVGWSRYYQMQFEDAALTFKYVNTTSKDPNARHEALVGLMRSFVAVKDFDNALAVSNLLDKETGLERNARELFLTRADYFIRTEQPALAIPQLERAIPLITLKDERSRTRYVLAQLYQDAGENKKAYEQLNQILARNPPYELDFFAKLMLGQVSDLGAQDRARLDKYFAQLLQDPKNKEYRDKIYYEMARLEYRQQHYGPALALLTKSIKASTTNQTQKSYTYLLAGRINYENLQKYRPAAAYYDSTVQAMSKEAKNYAVIKERSEILKEFAKQYTIIETQDSLQALARLDKDVLSKRLDEYAGAEIIAKAKAAAAKAAADKIQAKNAEFAARQEAGGNLRPQGLPGSAGNPGGSGFADPLAFDPTAAGGGAKWYFDNPITLGTARTDFRRKWGDRRLVDNWRTVAQSSNSLNAGPNGDAALPGQADPGERTLQSKNALAADSLAKAKAKAADPAAEQRALVETYRKALPLNPDLLAASDVLTEDAYYKLGSIYKELLKELDKGIATWQKQTTRYAQGKRAPEAYYLLYLHFKNLPDAARQVEYAAALQRYFPTSVYAKLIADPLYREHEQALHKAVAAKVDAAFLLYKEQEFRKASAALAEVEAAYPKNDLTDRIAYLKTLLVVRTQSPLTAKASVEQFYKDFPTSPLAPLAQELAKSYAKQGRGELAGALASTEKPRISVFRPGEIDNRMRILYTEKDFPTPIAPPPTPALEEEAQKIPQKPAAELAPGGSAGPAPSGMPMPAPEAPEMRKNGAPTEASQLKGKGAVIEAAQLSTPTTPAASAAVAADDFASTAAGITPGAATSAAAPAGATGATGASVAGTTGTAASAPAPPAAAPPAAGPAVVPRGARPSYRVPAKRGAAVPKKAAPANAAGRPATTGGAPVTPASALAAPVAAGASGVAPAAAGSAAPGALAGNAAPTAAAPTVAYTVQLAAPHAVVLVFDKAQPAASDLAAQLTAYNGRFFRTNGLQVLPQPLDSTHALLVVRPLPSAAVAKSYASKLRGPQSPLAKLRGAGCQALVISATNLLLLQGSKDVAGYQAFYQKSYK